MTDLKASHRGGSGTKHFRVKIADLFFLQITSPYLANLVFWSKTNVGHNNTHSCQNHTLRV
jgi:hypothetical protein